MQWMLDLRTYGLKIHYNTTLVGHVGWKRYDELLYKDLRFTMSEFRGMVHGLVMETRRLLKPGSELGIDWVGVERYTSQVAEFREKLLVFMHITGSQPARVPEILSVRHSNTAGREERSKVCSGTVRDRGRRSKNAQVERVQDGKGGAVEAAVRGGDEVSRRLGEGYQGDHHGRESGGGGRTDGSGRESVFYVPAVYGQGWMTTVVPLIALHRDMKGRCDNLAQRPPSGTGVDR